MDLKILKINAARSHSTCEIYDTGIAILDNEFLIFFARIERENDSGIIAPDIEITSVKILNISAKREEFECGKDIDFSDETEKSIITEINKLF